MINFFKNYFEFEKHGTNFRKEILAGATTFVTMVYVLALAPGMLSQTGMDKGAVFTATAVGAFLGSTIMGFLAKLPVALAPGVGLLAFFTYTVCITLGYSWQFALTAVFIEGIIFAIMSILNIREIIFNAIPASLKLAISVGIGLFITFIGLQNSGLVVDNPATLVTLGNLHDHHAIVTMIGLVITSLMLIWRIPAAILLGIILSTIVGIFLGITNLPQNGIFSSPPSISPIFCQFEWNNIFTFDMLFLLITFLFVDVFDTIGSLIGITSKANLMGKDGKLPHIKEALLSDSLATIAGAVLGTSTITAYVESASGVSAGGKTGFTAFVVGLLFLLALFLSPFFLIIPSASTAAALILVGLFMMAPILEIDFHDYTEAVPAFLTIVLIPLTYSIANGIAVGFISYVLLNLLSGKHRHLSVAMYVLTIIFALKLFL